MKLFSNLYDKTIRLARHDKAPTYLAGLSFAESSFFPIPPDVMLAPMVIAKPSTWLWLAALTTIASVLGGIAGYFIGMFAWEWLEPLIHQWGYADRMELAKTWFSKWGVWVVFAAGFSPIPYKIFTVTAGALSMAFLPFVIASLIGRGARFFLVAGLLAWAGPKMEPAIKRYIEWIGWLVVAAIAIVILLIKV